MRSSTPGHCRGDLPLIGVETRISAIADAYRAVLTCVARGTLERRRLAPPQPAGETCEVGLLFVFDDVNRSLLSGGRAAANTGVLSYQLRLCVFAKPPVWRDKPTCSHTADFT
jgi:hypothetical protein